MSQERVVSLPSSFRLTIMGGYDVKAENWKKVNFNWGHESPSLSQSCPGLVVSPVVGCAL